MRWLKSGILSDDGPMHANRCRKATLSLARLLLPPLSFPTSRPVVCSVGSYRLKGACKTCPNTAWLLFLGFALVIVGAVALAVYLSKKKINFAGLSIGVVSSRVLVGLMWA